MFCCGLLEIGCKGSVCLFLILVDSFRLYKLIKLTGVFDIFRKYIVFNIENLPILEISCIFAV